MDRGGSGGDAVEAQLRAQIDEVRRRSASSSTPDPTLGKLLTALAMYHFRGNKFDQAVSAGDEALQAFEQALPADHPFIISAKTNLGLFLCPTGQLQRAEALLVSAVQTARRDLPNSMELGQALHNLALLFRNNSRWEEAEATYREAVSVLSATAGATVTVTIRDQGFMWAMRGDKVRAAETFHLAEREVRARMPPENAEPVLRQLQLDLESLKGTNGPDGNSNAAVTPAAPTAPAGDGRGSTSIGGDAGGRLRESSMRR